MEVLPKSVEPYRTIGPFDQDTIPKGLFREHSTKRGVWGLLEVESGSVRYVVTDPTHAASYVLDRTCAGVIVPEQKHHLEILGDVRFQITFYREPNQ